MYKAWVYILKCCDNSYYIGKTQNLEKRIEEHNNGVYTGYTFNRRPVKLVYSHGFLTFLQAIQTERQLKGWSRAKKEALINSEFELLHELAKCKNASNFQNYD